MNSEFIFKVGERVLAKADWEHGPKKGDVLTIEELDRNPCTEMQVAVFIGYRSWYSLEGSRFGKVAS